VTTIVFFAVLLAAVLHASWNAFVKAADDGLISIAILGAGQVALGFILVLHTGLPTRAALPYLALSIIVHQAYHLGLVMQYRFGDLGQVYPLARGASPLLVAGAAWWLAGESLNGWSGLAIVIICAGIVSLSLVGRGTAHNGKALAWASFTALSIAGYSIADGLGARLTPEPLSYIAWLFLLNGMPPVAVALILRNRRQIQRALAQNGWRSGLGGPFSLAAYGIVIWAMTKAPLAHVTALRETSVIVAALIGSVLFKETFGGRRVAAATVIVAGIAMLQLSSRL
jgi:drug/metabolite transporter (DMT)-like permease